jgi:hypothetical protein
VWVMCVVIGHVTCEGGLGRGGVWLACEGGYTARGGEESRSGSNETVSVRRLHYHDMSPQPQCARPTAAQADCPSEQESNPGE